MTCCDCPGERLRWPQLGCWRWEWCQRDRFQNYSRVKVTGASRCPRGSHTHTAFTSDTYRPHKTCDNGGTPSRQRGTKWGLARLAGGARTQGGAPGGGGCRHLLGDPRGTEAVGCMQRKQLPAGLIGWGSWSPGWSMSWAGPRGERGGGVSGRNFAESVSAEEGRAPWLPGGETAAVTRQAWAAGPRPRGPR